MFIQLKTAYLGKPAGERLDVPDEHAQLLIEQGVAEALQHDPIAPLLAKSMERMLASPTGRMNRALPHAVKQLADAHTSARKHAVPAIFGPKGDGDPHGKSFGDWLLAVRRGDAKYLADTYDSHLADWEGAGRKAAMATTGGTVGGYTVPVEFLPR